MASQDTASLVRMRRLSKSDSGLSSLEVEDAHHVVPGSRRSRCRSVARLLEVLCVDNVLTSEQAEAATSHFQSMPLETQSDWLRILLMNLVKNNQLTIEAAERYASQFALDTKSAQGQTETYNFPVYKWNKLTRSAQRRILQFDFQSKTMLSMHRGQIHKTFNFIDILRYEGDVST
jgi:hypothetical protein